MLLVPSRPIPLPVLRPGMGWYDDFAVTGAINSAYSQPEKRVKTNYGIRIETVAFSGTGLQLTAWANLAIETIMRRVAGASAIVNFRHLDQSNRLYVELSSAGTLKLFRVVAGSYTTLASVGGVDTTSWNRVGVRAVGPAIDVILNGRRVIAVNETANISQKIVRLIAYDATAGVAKAEFQYLAIRPL